MTQTLDHVVVVHILIWDKRKSQIKKYSDNAIYTTTMQDHLLHTASWTIDLPLKLDNGQLSLLRAS